MSRPCRRQPASAPSFTGLRNATRWKRFPSRPSRVAACRGRLSRDRLRGNDSPHRAVQQGSNGGAADRIRMQSTPQAAAHSRLSDTGPLTAFVMLALVWGYNWVVMKVAMRYSGPMDFAVLRSVLGVVVLFAVLLALRAPLKPRHVGKTI